jgi:TfoX/Sxy family transcriptional regulator of competence genes
MAKKATRRMPAFTKAPQDLVDQFTAAVERLPDVTVRKMFSYPAAFSHGQMFAYVFRDEVILRLPETDRTALQAEGWKPFEPMPGRRSAKYLAVPPAVLSRPAALAPWLKKAHAYAASLPAKPKK